MIRVRRFFVLSFLLLPWLWLACGGGDPAPSGGGQTNPPPPPPVPDPVTNLDKALAIGKDLASKATADGTGMSWTVAGSTPARPMYFYEGSAGILWYLAALQRVSPLPERATLLESAGRRLESVTLGNLGLLEEGGRTLAFLALHDALGGTRWLEAARASALRISMDGSFFPGDLLYALPGTGFVFLGMEARTQEALWLDKARQMGDSLLASAKPEQGGLSWETDTVSGLKVSYSGMAHGNAGAAFFLARLARRLGPTAGAPYLKGAQDAAKALDQRRVMEADGPSWPRRLPDDAKSLQWTWCHGSPGIGLFYVELYLASGDPNALATAKACGEQVWSRRNVNNYPNVYACFCHGRTGNAQIFLALYRTTGDATWKSRAEETGKDVWSMRLPNQPLGWEAADGSGANNPGLMNGTAGVGYYYLQLHDPDRFRAPIHD